MAPVVAIPLVIAAIGSLVVAGLETAGQQEALQTQITATDIRHQSDELALNTNITRDQGELDTVSGQITDATAQLEYDLNRIRERKAADLGTARASAAARGIGTGGTAEAIQTYIEGLADADLQRTQEAGDTAIAGMETRRDYLSGLLEPGGYYAQQQSLLDQDYTNTMTSLREQTTNAASFGSFATSFLGNFLPFLGMVGTGG